jgi:hypothetical protein
VDSSGTFSRPDGAPLSEAKQKLLARYLSGRTATNQISAIAARPKNQPAPLAWSQEQLWLRERGTHGIPPLYNECIILRMAEELDVPVLERSFTEVIRRHEIWRTSYQAANGIPLQLVHTPSGEIRLPVIDLRSLPSTARREAEAERIVGEMVRQPFNLKEGPLVRAKMLRIEDVEYRLFLCAHLSIVDGVSVYQVFPAELSALYRAYRAGQPSPLPEIEVQFGDYAYWQRRRPQESLSSQIDYWRKQLAPPLPVLSWPADQERPRQETFRGAIRAHVFPKSLSEAVKALGQREGVTLFMVLVAALTALLHSYTQQEDIIVGTPSPAGRKRSEVQKLLGYFLNPVALRFALAGNPSFRELLQQTQRVTLEAISNDDVPLEILAQELKLERDLSRNPFFTVAVSLQPATPQLPCPWSVTTMDIESGGAPWDLYLAFIERPSGIMGRAQYNPDLFEIEIIEQVWEHLRCLLETVSTNPAARLSEISTLMTRECLANHR